jgi:hypothetical protein
MTTREHCRRVGLSSAKELAYFHGVTACTVSYWRRNNPELFDKKLAEAAITKRNNHEHCSRGF